MTGSSPVQSGPPLPLAPTESNAIKREVDIMGWSPCTCNSIISVPNSKLLVTVQVINREVD